MAEQVSRAFQDVSIRFRIVIFAWIGPPGATEKSGMDCSTPAPLGFGQMLRPDVLLHPQILCVVLETWT